MDVHCSSLPDTGALPAQPHVKVVPDNVSGLLQTVPQIVTSTDISATGTGIPASINLALAEQGARLVEAMRAGRGV